MSGVRIDMGPCAVVRHAGVTILLTSKKTPPFDLGQLRSQGIEPETLHVIGVKAAVAHCRAYDRIAREALPSRPPVPARATCGLFPIGTCAVRFFHLSRHRRSALRGPFKSVVPTGSISSDRLSHVVETRARVADLPQGTAGAT